MKGYYAAGWCSTGFTQMTLIMILSYVPVMFLGLIKKVNPEFDISLNFFLIPTFILSLCLPLIMGLFHIKSIQKQYGTLTANAALYMFATTKNGESPAFESPDELHKAVTEGKYPKFN